MRGVTVVRLGYQADPEKATPEWKAAMQVGVAHDVWEREFEGNASAGLGLAIYGREYRPETHERPLAVDPMMPVLHTWDFGRGAPAHLWFQRTRHHAVRVIAELVGKDTQLRPFAERVIAYEVNELGGPFNNRRDYCDPAGNQPKDDGMKSVEVLREFGWLPRWRGSTHDERHEYVSGLLLRTQEDGAPMVLVDPRRCPILTEAFRSRYRRDKRGEPERIHPWIDVMDAFHYGIINTKSAPRAVQQQRMGYVNPVTGYGGWARPALPFGMPR